MHNPYTTALTGLGKVSGFVIDKIVPALLNFDDLNQQEQDDVSSRLQVLTVSVICTVVAEINATK